MKSKGFTLIEVLLSIFLIGLISISFLPIIASGYKNIVSSQKFTEDLYEEQRYMENKIAELKDIEPIDDYSLFDIYGKTIKSHKIDINTSSGKIKAYIPKKNIKPIIPIIQSPPVIEVRKGATKVSPQPNVLNLLNDEYHLFVNEIDITNNTRDNYLMSIYRWYISEEVNNEIEASNSLDQYFIIKEWNEAKKQLSFAKSGQLKFIPNIKDNYNSIKFSDVQNELNFDHETLINTLGNRYIRYGVTPFAVSGHIGKEELSQEIYIEAPKIEVESAWVTEFNEIYIYFKEDIEDSIDLTKIDLNDELGVPQAGRRDEDNHKLLILTVYNIDNTKDFEGNKLSNGAISSKNHGRISVWYNNTPEGEFIINKYNP